MIQIIEDLNALKITTDFNEIKKMKKTTFKSLVKDNIKKIALEYLNNIKIEHSKMDNLEYTELNIQQYLNSTKIYPQLAKNIFKWRTRMVNFKCNFKNGSADTLCPLGCQDEDLQENILKCQVILNNITSIASSDVVYANIFSKQVQKIKVTIELLQKAFKVRENLIEEKSKTE